MTLGETIQKLRKQKGLSQEDLADAVTVTRQTISKWELNQSTPDLDFIAQLSNIFQVSSDYLIRDEMEEPDILPPTQKPRRLTEKGKRFLLAALSAGGLVAICVCLICDYFTTGRMSWSLVAAVSIAAGWFLALPFLVARTGVLRKTLLAASVVPFPLLAVLALLLKRPVVFLLGGSLALLGVAAVWILYAIFQKWRRNLWRAFGFALLLMVPAPVLVTHLAAAFLPGISFASNPFNCAITLVLSLACFGADYLFGHKGR